MSRSETCATDHVCQDETATVVNGKWICNCPKPSRAAPPAPRADGLQVRFPPYIPRWYLDRVLAAGGIKLRASWKNPQGFDAELSVAAYEAVIAEARAAVADPAFKAITEGGER